MLPNPAESFAAIQQSILGFMYFEVMNLFLHCVIFCIMEFKLSLLMYALALSTVLQIVKKNEITVTGSTCMWYMLLFM